MGGYKGQTGSSTNLEKPVTRKHKTDQEQYKKQLRANTEYYMAYYCSSCKKKFEMPPKNSSGVFYCADCMIKNSKFVELKETKAYRFKGDIEQVKKKKKKGKK